jgi:hypothetical protein
MDVDKRALYAHGGFKIIHALKNKKQQALYLLLF